MTTNQERPFITPIGYQYGEMPRDPDPIWVAIRAARIERGLTIAQVAQMAKVASSTVSRGERGFHAWLDSTRKVAEVLEVQILAVRTPRPQGGID